VSVASRRPATESAPAGASTVVAIRAPSLIRLVMRRSVGRPAVLAAAAVIVANVTLRTQGWVHEWYWAWFNYHFVMVFLGPLAAGLGAWEGARLARASDLLESSGTTPRALCAAGGAVFTWLLIPYLAGLGLISTMVKAAESPGGPGIIEISTLGPALALLAMWAVIGAAAGFRSGSPLAAPLAAIVSFALILAFYMIDYTLVRVGGATGSLLGLAPRPEIQLGQCALYLTAAVGGVAWATQANRPVLRDPSRLVTLASGTLAMVIGIALFSGGGPEFRQRSVSMRCSGQPPICLARGYDRHPEKVRAAFVPLFAGLRDIDAPLPKKMRMGGVSEEDLVGVISEDLALGKNFDGEAASNLISAYIRWSCKPYDNENRERAWSDLYAWFGSLDGSRPITPNDPFVSQVLKTGSKEDRAAYLRDAIDRLRRCA
jgi:hypothetical protein